MAAVYLIVNPVSGKGRRGRLLATLCERLREAGMDTEIHETRGPGDAERLAGAACRPDVRALVIAGGDGTINEAVRGLHEGAPPVLIVPFGTENVLAKFLGMRAEVDDLYRALTAGREVRMDAGTANGRRFMVVAGVGFDAEIVRRLSEARRGHISYWSYVVPIWRTFWGYRHPALRVEVDGAVLFEGPGMAFVGIVNRYALGMRLLTRAVHDDGLLDVCVLRCSSRIALLLHAVRVLLGRHVACEGVIYHQAREVRVASSEQVALELDGDSAGFLPVQFGIIPGAVRFLLQGDFRS